MKKVLVVFAVVIVIAALFFVWLISPPTIETDVQFSSDPAVIARGEYLVIAGGCVSCHQRSESDMRMSGGLVLETDFGRFFAPNITPDVETGIGDWQASDFVQAMRHGRTPTGSFYYPAFPYRAYAGLSETEVLEIGSYLFSLEPIANEVPDPEVPWWLNRWTIALWNRLADLQSLPGEQFTDELTARGEHLARDLGHCGECHTPRNSLGIPVQSLEFAGAELGDQTIEAIDAEALSDWTTQNFDLFLLIGMKPDGEFAGGDMNDVVEHNTSKLTDEDRDALAAFFTRQQNSN